MLIGMLRNKHMNLGKVLENNLYHHVANYQNLEPMRKTW